MNFFEKLKNQTKNSAVNSVNNFVNKANRKSVDIVFEEIPETLEAFCALPQAELSTPFDTAAMTIVALSVYPMNRELSFEMLNFLRGPRELSMMDKQFIIDRFRDKDYVPRSYFKGAIPSNDYMPSSPFVIKVVDNPYSYQERGYANLYITSGGADSPRSVKMRLAKDGKWYLWEQFLLSDIRKPESKNPWA